MSHLLCHLPLEAALRTPDAVALRTRTEQVPYAVLAQLIQRVAQGLCGLGLQKQDRVAIYLPKRVETVATCFGTSLAGGVFVPVNPCSRRHRLAILRDSGAAVLFPADRIADLSHEVSRASSVRHVTSA
jgi:acyl-CoA synthetase (AMP-forming)/AMP-acid ligase II